MRLDPTQEVIRQIDGIVTKCEEALDNQVTTRPRGEEPHTDVPHSIAIEVLTLAKSTIARLRPKEEGFSPNVGQCLHSTRIEVYLSILKALRFEYADGRLSNFGGLIRADLFDDFLATADRLLAERYKDAAAVTAGGVLEQHIRKLCVRYGIPLTFQKDGDDVPKKLSALLGELKDNHISQLDWRQAQAWADLRNSAAHAKYDDYTATQVRQMIDGLRDFIVRNPS